MFQGKSAKGKVFPEKSLMPRKSMPDKKKRDSCPLPGHTVDRWISKLGLGTRGMAREWVRDGRLSLGDGTLVQHVDQFVQGTPGSEPVFRLDQKILSADPPAVFAFNKPRGVLVTRTDPGGRETICESIGRSSGQRTGMDMSRLMPVGRLDQASSGLILLTNRSSELTRLLNPALEFPREYRVQVRPSLKKRDWEMGLFGGKWARELGLKPVDVRYEKENLRTTWLRVGLKEGKNREIRRLFESGGYEVLHLIRVGFGPFCLKNLPPGGIVEVSSFFLCKGKIVLDIILDMIHSGDIIEVKENGVVVSPGIRARDQ
ncbi:pseudouridylate synthase [Leptospirillum ferriphilum]|uniref:Pseudouridine synthase n=3 Tax=Leptospirillum TaxID=179 RepID=A0A094X7Q4_9BACT|nr:hypothetical protein ABH19_12135 [Leptospirillum sp. Group II 'CF-1']KGA94524.1 pseudouridylate synthase [Leptospirillum ferriphilum]